MRIIFGTGGTGGHLYPALALASYIERQDPTSEFLFVEQAIRRIDEEW